MVERPCEPNDTSVKRRHKTAERTALLVVFLLTAIVLSKDITVGGLRDGDTAVHAMDGVLIHDWVAAGPDAWLHPIRFAKEQYGHYPCLGIGRHYPPGFAVVEAVFFALLGISAFTARLCVVFFGLLAGAGVYTFTRMFSDRLTSMLAAIVTLTLPAVTFWGRQAMLELPTLSILIWAAVTFCWYLKKPSARRLLAVGGMGTLALLFRQHAVLFFGAVSITLCYCSLHRTVPWSHTLWSVVVTLAAIVLVTLSFEGAAASMLRGRPTYPSLWETEALTYYFRQLPGQVGVGVLGAAVLGLFVWPKRFRTHHVFLIAWFATGYIMLSTADLKWPRFLFVVLLPPAIWATVALSQAFSWNPLVRVRRVMMATAGIALCLSALAEPVQHYPDYGAVVSAYRNEIRNHPILFGGTRDNHFVFSVRQHVPYREAIVIRSSKLLYLCSTVPSVDFVGLVNSEEELADVMRRFAFPFVFTEQENRFGIEQEALLRTYLSQSGDYRHAATHALREDSKPTSRDSTIDVYRLAQPLTRSVDYFDIRIPRSELIVRVSLPPSAG